MELGLTMPERTRLSETPINITQDLSAINLYQKSLEAPEKNPFFDRFPIGVSWTLTIEVILKNLIEKNITDVEKIFELQNTYLYSIDQDDEQIKTLTFKLWQDYLERKGVKLEELPEALQESDVYDPKKLLWYKGKKYSLDFFSKLNLAWDINSKLTAAGIKRPHVFEVGGGYGQMARVLKIMNPNSRYTVLDLPETLYFSYINLKLNFPNSVIAWAHNSETLETLVREQKYDFLMVPCYLAEKLAALPLHIDAALNKSSFGEMNNKTSAFYIDLIQNKLNVKRIFFLNRFLNSVDPDVQSYRIHENQWYHNLDGRWKFLKWEVEPEFTQFPYNEVLHHRELYVVAERTTDAVALPKLDDILASKWYSSFTIVPFARHSNVLAVNLGLGGTLERLVNAVRLTPTAVALDALIKYIFILEGKFPYEERYYYCDLYRSLTKKKHPLAARHPLMKYKLISGFLRISGISTLLSYPHWARFGLNFLKSTGINLRWTYDKLKSILFSEKK